MMKKFEQDECLLMAICQEDTCEQTKEEMKKILPFLKHDTEMTALVKGTLEKMEHLTEEEFSKMDLTPDSTELLEEKEWI